MAHPDSGPERLPNPEQRREIYGHCSPDIQIICERSRKKIFFRTTSGACRSRAKDDGLIELVLAIMKKEMATYQSGDR